MIIGLPVWIALLAAATARAIAAAARRIERRRLLALMQRDPAECYMDLVPGAAW